MATPVPYFVYPFGVSGDTIAVPLPTQVSGSMSYQSGFPINYEEDLATNPAAIPLNRSQFNQLMLDITTALQQYQQYGTPNWITSAENLGVSFPYPIYSRVYYDAGGGPQIYENQVAGNTATPGADDTWQIVSGAPGGVPIGTVIDFAGVYAPMDYLLCDGSAVSRATYTNLLPAITSTQNGTTTNTRNTLTGLTDTSVMYVGMPLEGTGIPTSTTVASIVNSTSITMSNTATASATVPVTFYPWGNGDGSTTFNIPDFRRTTSMGSGGTGTATIGSVTGQYGGVETYTLAANDLPAHVHPPAQGQFIISQTPGTVAVAAGNGLGVASFTANNVTANNPVSLYQPTNVLTKCIKAL